MPVESTGSFIPQPLCCIAPTILLSNLDKNRLSEDFRFVFTVTLFKIIINFYKALQNALVDDSENEDKSNLSDFIDFITTTHFKNVTKEEAICFQFMAPFYLTREPGEEEDARELLHQAQNIMTLSSSLRMHTIQ
jgi:hypothetical protein